MTEPVVAYPIREVLSRMEVKLDKVQEDVHQLQLAQSAAQAVSRSRAALWAAVTAGLTAGAALVVALAR